MTFYFSRRLPLFYNFFVGDEPPSVTYDETVVESYPSRNRFFTDFSSNGEYVDVRGNSNLARDVSIAMAQQDNDVNLALEKMTNAVLYILTTTINKTQFVVVDEKRSKVKISPITVLDV